MLLSNPFSFVPPKQFPILYHKFYIHLVFIFNMKKKKTKEFNLPMEFNPMLNKFEPVLPLRKNSLKIEMKKKRKRNWWAFWYLVIGTIIFLLFLILALI